MTDLTTLADAQAQDQRLRGQASELRLHGLLGRWSEVMAQPEQARWVAQLLGWEAAERHRRSLERRLRGARIGPFKPLADFDWKWPTHCDRGVLEELMTLAFLEDASNVVLVGPNGVGKTMCACNLGYQAVLAGRTALFITAAQLLGELASLDSDSALRRRLRHYAAPDLLMIDLCAEHSDVKWHARTGVDPHGRPFSLNITNRTVDPSSTMEGTHAQCHLPQRSRPVRAVSLCGRT